MEYLYYVLVIVILLALCLLALRRSAIQTDETPLHRRPGRERPGGSRADPSFPAARRQATLKRELKKVPTPWGWPGSDMHHGHDAAGPEGGGDQGPALQHWVEWLTHEKRTVDDDEYRLRRDASLRALLEDRFGRAVEPRTQRYETVRPPRLRDPSLPYDQQDNFPSGKTGQIIGGLGKQPGPPTRFGQSAPPQRRLKEIKKPWGW